MARDMSVIYLLLALFCAINVSSSLDINGCFNCWNTLCAAQDPDNNFVNNIGTYCPCECINYTMYHSANSNIQLCNQVSIVPETNSQCCSRADDGFINSFINSSISPVPFSGPNNPVDQYNPPPDISAFSLSDYEEIELDHQYVYFGIPFTAHGCITNISINNRFSVSANINLNIQLWSKNTIGNSTILRLKKDGNVEFSASSTKIDYPSSFLTTASVSNEFCFIPGDIFGIIVLDTFTDIDMLQEETNSANGDFYARAIPNCQSLKQTFNLISSQIVKRPLVAVGVSNIPPPLPSTSSSSLSEITSTTQQIMESSSVTTSSPGTTSTYSSISVTSNIPATSSYSSSRSLEDSSSDVLSSPLPTSTSVASPTEATAIAIYVAAGVVSFIFIILIIFVILLCSIMIFVIRARSTSKHIVTKPTEMHIREDSLDFDRVLIPENSHRYNTDTLNSVNTKTTVRQSETPSSVSSNHITDSFETHDYDDPNAALNLVSFRTSYDNMLKEQGPDYMTMINSNNIRTTTPSGISLGSDRSQYSQPRSVQRYQSPSTNQRYDSPRSLMGSGQISDYDDPTNVLNRTPLVNHRGIIGQRYTPSTNNYQVLENPNEETGQPERPYFELEPPAVSHQYQTLEIVGYHVPTLNERMSLMPHGEDGPPILPPRPNQKQFFQEQPFYWEPSQQTEVIYEELNKFKCREILLTDIKFTEEIGEGQFGSVWSGVWQLATGGKKIAIKVLKQSANEEEKAKFLREGARMMQFFHPNVVKLHGVCTLNNPPLLIQELMGKGDLKSYLKHCRPNANNANPNKNSHPIPTPKLLLKFCRDIASGMKHLANKMFIHRDLAARNVLLNDNLICKIADFGLTRASSHFFDPSKSEQIPLRWTAPEAIHLRQYSEKSDVYSYGMTLFEIWSLGKKPFPKLNQTQEIIDFINQRRLLPPPPGCPRTIYHLMVKCWNPSPDGRLPFDTICNDYFSTNDEALLTWEDEDFEISQRAAEIGAPLSEGYHLYEELQHEYRYNQ